MLNKKSLKIICATAVAIFNLFCCFMSSFAWFTAAKNLNGDEMAIKIEANELHLTYEAYKFDESSKEIIKITDLNLNPYDTVIKERNENNAIIIKTILSSNLFSNKTVSDVEISLKCSSASYYDDSLSNITHFKFAILNDIEDIYHDGITGLENISPLKFLTTVKLTELTYTISDAPIIDNQITVYGLFNYDEELIDARNIDITDEIPIFSNDIEYIRYGIHE